MFIKLAKRILQGTVGKYFISLKELIQEGP